MSLKTEYKSSNSKINSAEPLGQSHDQNGEMKLIRDLFHFHCKSRPALPNKITDTGNTFVV